MKKVTQFFMAFLLLVFGTSIVLGCTCVAPNIRKEYKRNKIIFQGKVIEVEGNNVKFEIEKTWKGDKQNQITIQAYPNSSDGNCGDGFAFEKGEKYVVFIYDKDLTATTDCTPSFHIVSHPQERKFDKPLKYQEKVFSKLNNPLFRLWAKIYPF